MNKLQIPDDDQVENYIDAKETLTEAKAHEMELRREICDMLFIGWDDPNSTIETDNYKLKATAKQTTKMDLPAFTNEVDYEDLTALEQSCFEEKLVFIFKNLKHLPKDSIIWKYITTEPATPTLEVKEL